MVTIPPLQTVTTKAEIFALELAQMLADGKRKEASAKLKTYADEHRIGFGEASAISHIASCMFHGKRWKKDA